MINRDVFAAGIAILAEAFGREISGPGTRVYYGALSAQLTDEEFQRAIQVTLETETYWPSPAVILAKVKATSEATAIAALEHVRDTLSAHGGYRFMTHEVYLAFDAPTKAGIKAIGGLRELTMVETDRYPALVKRFIRAYADALSPASQLDSGEQLQPQVRELTARTAAARSIPRTSSGGRDRSLPVGDRT